MIATKNCVLVCNQFPVTARQWQFDHVVPISKKGFDSIENKVVSCKLCNFINRNFVDDAAGEIVPVEKILKLTKDRIAKGSNAKIEHLNKIKEVLFRHRLVSPERLERKVN